jgi:hypothetical protein
MNNPETLVSPGTQNTGQINVKENQRGNQECCPVFCVPGVTSVSGLFILDYPFGFL